jgi:hypothetical protein
MITWVLGLKASFHFQRCDAYTRRRFGVLEWPALIRKLDRAYSTYKKWADVIKKGNIQLAQ